MVKVDRRTIIIIILLGIILTVILLNTFSIYKNQNNREQVSAQRVVNEYLNYNEPLADLIDISSINPSKLSIRIEKLKFKLTLYHNSTAIKSYPVVFGFNAIDDKLRQGDGCTPEGIFKIWSKYPHASWSRFIWIDYPNQDSWIKHNAAKKNGKIPSNANIGGEVGIHGVPKGSMSSSYAVNNYKHFF